MSSIKSFFKINLPRKIDLLLIIRGFLAYAVLVWHFKGYEYPIKELAFITIPGRMAVWLFFILSGYLIGFGFSSGFGSGSGFGAGSGFGSGFGAGAGSGSC